MNEEIRWDEDMQNEQDIIMMEDDVFGDEYLARDAYKKSKEKKGGPSSGSRAGAAAISTATSGGSTEDIVGSGLMASGNPYAMAAGAGLMVLSASQKRKQREAEAKAIAKQQRIERQQRALENLTRVSEGLKRL